LFSASAISNILTSMSTYHYRRTCQASQQSHLSWWIFPNTYFWK